MRRRPTRWTSSVSKAPGVLGVRTEAGTSRLWPARLPPRPDRSLAAASKEIIARLRKPWRPAGPAGPAKRRAGRPARPEAEVFVSVSLQASPLPPKALSPPPRHLTPGPHPPPRPRPRARLSAPSVSSRLRPRGLRSGTWPRCEAPCLGNVLCSPQRQRDCQRHLHCDSGG